MFSSSKNFEPKHAKEHPPENCGYALRLFSINLEEEIIEIKDMKKHIETRINLKDVKRVLLGAEAKKLVQKLRDITLKPNTIMNHIFNQDFIQFSLIVEHKSFELIAQNYQIFSCFSHAVEEIAKNKKNIGEILRFIENKN